MAKPLGSAEPRLKNTDYEVNIKLFGIERLERKRAIDQTAPLLTKKLGVKTHPKDCDNLCFFHQYDYLFIFV